MPTSLSPLDVAVVVAYVLGTVLVGVWFSARQGALTTYFVGDRNVSWWLVLASIVATETSAVTFLSVPGLAFHSPGGNLTFLQLAFGYVLGRALIAWLLLPQYLRGEVLSAYQVLQRRFDASVQRTASGLFLLTRAVADGLRLYLAALLLQVFTGWNGYVAVLVIGLVSSAYTYLGGIQAIVWTDLVQMLIYLGGAVVAGVCLLYLVPGGLAGYLEQGQAAGKFVWLNLSTDPTERYTLWTGLIGGAFFTMASHGADQMMVQRYLCSRSLAQARLALVLSGVVVLGQFVLFLLLGVGLYVLAQGGILRMSPSTRDDEVFGLFIVRYLPIGVVGLVVAGVLSAAMATLASSLNSAANAFVTDFYRPLRPGRGERHYLVVSKVATLGWGLTRIGVALGALAWAGNRSVIDQAFTVAGFTTGMVLGLFLLGRLRVRVAPRAALVGLVAGFVAVGLVFVPPLWGGPLLAWPWYAPIGTLTTVAVALVLRRLGGGERGSSGDGGAQPGLGAAG
jgi:SSS family transporter